MSIKPRVLLVTPPMVQVNAPYPATACLAGFLGERGYCVAQADLALELALRLFSNDAVSRIAQALRTGARRGDRRSPSVAHFLKNTNAYRASIDAAIRFLQGRDPTLALRISSRAFLPEGPRFEALEERLHDVESIGTHDLALHLASLFLDDLTDVIRDGIDPRFDLARYGERLADSAPNFDGMDRALRGKPTLVDDLIDNLAETCLRTHQPEVVGITVPFPGTVYGAFRIAQKIKTLRPAVRIVLGGGYVNTELRELSDLRVFKYVDYVTLDDGEMPLLCLLEHLEGKRTADDLLRVLLRSGQRVVLRTNAAIPDVRHAAAGTPTFTGLPLDGYFSMVEMLNPMHRLWSDGRWNKLPLARGCYWHKCRFCDVSLDYIRRFDPAPADMLVDRIVEVMGQTGQSGFHFVDEAAPPALLRRLAERLIERKVQISWWGNIRFEKAFTPELARLLAESGCIAVTGGLEAATDRLLRVLHKGFTLTQAARVTHGLAEAGIMVHAYLMYGCPSQTPGETLDALEFVRQLFAMGCLQSAFWHRFALTVHSPFARAPSRFGIRRLHGTRATFATNEIPYADRVGCDHATLGQGLRRAVYNYMLGVGIDLDVATWFDQPVPNPTLPLDFVEMAIRRKADAGMPERRGN